MKRKLSLILVLVALAALAAFVLFRPRVPETLEVAREELSLRDGRLHRADESAPFTGRMIERYPDGTLKSRSMVVNGLLDGASQGWHTNGQPQIVEHFKQGTSHGPRKKWYEDGTAMSETMIQTGEHHGMFRRWHENGQLAEEVTMVQGKAHGPSLAYYPSGYLKARAVLKNGEVVEQLFWQDGEKLLAGSGDSQ